MSAQGQTLAIEFTMREWVKIAAALVMRVDMDPKLQPIIEVLHDRVIEPMSTLDAAIHESSGPEHDPRCISLTDSEFNDHCDCATLRLIDTHEPPDQDQADGSTT